MTDLLLSWAVAGVLLLNGWLAAHRRRIERQHRQQVRHLEAELDRLNANLDALCTDLRVLFPRIRQPKK